nr:reverse transcriptase domain-containing protein [Tanacetum cinerariifolium]
MSTRSSARNLFPPLDNPDLTIRRRSRYDPTLLNNSEMAAEGPDELRVPDLRTMEELCRPSLNGRNSCQFHGLPGDDANKHLDKFLHVTQSIKVNEVTDDALRLYLFPHSLTHHATAWFDRLPRNSINTFEQMAKMFLGKYFPPSMVTKLRNEITNFLQRPLTYFRLIGLAVDVGDSYDPYSEPHINPDVKEDIDACIAFTDDIAARGMNARRPSLVPERRLRLGLIEEVWTWSCKSYMITWWRSRFTESELSRVSKKDQGHRIVVTNQQSDAMSKMITTLEWDNLRLRGMLAAGGTFIKRCPEECYDLIKNMTAHHNDWDTSAQQSESSSSINSSSDTKIVALKAEMVEINKNLIRVLQVNQQVKAVTPNCETCGGPHSFSNCPATVGNTQNVYAAGAYQGTLPSNTITNLNEDLKGITTRRGTAYPGPTIPTTSSSSVAERETEASKDTVHPSNSPTSGCPV